MRQKKKRKRNNEESRKETVTKEMIVTVLLTGIFFLSKIFQNIFFLIILFLLATPSQLESSGGPDMWHIKAGNRLLHARCHPPTPLSTVPPLLDFPPYFL